jgi:hypothetical protein
VTPTFCIDAYDIVVTNPSPAALSAQVTTTDATALTFTVAYSTDSSIVGTANIKVSPMWNGVVIAGEEVEYDLEVKDPCPTATITPSTHGAEKYTLSDAAKVVIVAPFNVIPAFCTANYALGIPTAISHVVTGDVATLSFTVDKTNDQSLVGTSSLTITAGNVVLTI